MRIFVVLMCLLFPACLQPLRRYTIGPLPEGTDRHLQVARSLTAAGVEVEEVDTALGKVASAWVAPFGNDWRRRFVAVVDDRGQVSLRVEVKICRPFQPCVPLQEVASQDLTALDALAKEVGEALHAPVALAPPL